MRTWTDIIEQRKVYHEVWGWGVATAESNDGLLFVHFDSDPWNPKRIPAEEVE